MKKFIEENWFKIVILIIVISCISLFFKYETRQQDIEKQAQLNNLDASCQKLASQKKDDISKNDPDLYIDKYEYEYKYNPTYKACILAYTGSYLGTSLMGKLGGYDLFEIDNLSTGESILHTQVNPGDTYRKANENFTQMKKIYISSQ
jgi:hypothetical protein